MKQLFIFLLIALITIYTSSPNNKKTVWFYSLSIPLVSLIFYSLLIFDLKTTYSATQDITYAILPATIAGFVIYNHLSIRLKNDNKVKVSPVLFIVIGVSLILAIVKYNSKFDIQDIDLSKSENNTSALEKALSASKKLDSANLKTKRFSFKGLTFKYTDNWIVTKEIIENDFAYQVFCEKKGIISLDVLCITWYIMDFPLIEAIKDTWEAMKEEPSHKNATISLISNARFNGETCKVANFSNTFMGESFYGQIISFNVHGKTFLILKQSDTKAKLDSEFKIMEESFEFNNN